MKQYYNVVEYVQHIVSSDLKSLSAVQCIAVQCSAVLLTLLYLLIYCCPRPGGSWYLPSPPQSQVKINLRYNVNLS